jgi:hypothetical protein
MSSPDLAGFWLAVAISRTLHPILKNRRSLDETHGIIVAKAPECRRSVAGQANGLNNAPKNNLPKNNASEMVGIGLSKSRTDFHPSAAIIEKGGG